MNLSSYLMLWSMSDENSPGVTISQCLRCPGSAEVQNPEHYNPQTTIKTPQMHSSQDLTSL